MVATRGRGRRVVRMLAWGLAVLLLLALAIVLAPSFLAPTLSARLTAYAGAPVRVAWISWNPLAAGATFHDVTVALAPDEPPVITIGAVRMRVALRSLLAGELILTRLVLKQPWVALRRTATGDFNLAVLFRTPSSPPPVAPAGRPLLAPPAASATRPPGVSPVAPAPRLPGAPPERSVLIRTLRIVGGSVEFRDETIAPVLETSLYLDDVTAEDLMLALGGQTDVAFHLESRLERRPLTLDATYRASGSDADLRVKLTTEGASLARTLLYVPLGWQRVSGTLDVTLSYTREVKGGRMRAHALQAQARLRDVALAEPWSPEPTVQAARAHLRAVAVDFLRRRTSLGTIQIDAFKALVLRDQSGIRVPLGTAASGAPDTRWRTVLSGVALGSGEVVLRNLVPGAEPELTASVQSGAIRPGEGGIAFTLDGAVAGGRVGVEGRATDEETRIRFALDGLSLPALAERLRLPVGFATGSVSGTVAARFGGGPAHFSGTLSVPGAKSLPSDAAHGEDIFAWHDLTLELADTTIDPLRIHVVKATADWPYLMIHRSPRAFFPFIAAHDGPGAAATRRATAAPAPPEDAPAVTIDTASARGGRIEFYDTTLPSPYWTELTDTELEFRGLSLPPLSVEHFQLTGALDELSPLEARGAIGPETTQVQTTVERFRLAPLNPYLQPALGYQITSGVGRVESTLTLRGSDLDAANDVVLSRFAMSSTGDDLFQQELGVPLSVALALMKDHRGDISLQLPVHGDLAAQEYRVGSVFLTVLRKALVGALRAPLTILGGVFHRKEIERFDLKPVPFPSGSAEIGPAGEARIAEVARLLDRHPTLSAVLIPDPSPADAEWLRDDTMIAGLEAVAPAARGPTDEALLVFLRARRTGASPVALAAEDAARLHALENATPVPLDRLAALAEARAAAVTGRLVEEHHLTSRRIGQTRWQPGEPRAQTVPGVDLQLRGD